MKLFYRFLYSELDKRLLLLKQRFGVVVKSKVQGVIYLL